MRAVSKLTTAFAAAAIYGLASAIPAYAQQEGSTPFPTAAAEDVDTGNASLAIDFKPRAICDDINARATDDVIARATNDEALSLIHEWGDSEQARDIITYRLCQEENLGEMGSYFLPDIINRLLEKPWFPATIEPFLAHDPGIFWRLSNMTGIGERFYAVYEGDQPDPEREEQGKIALHYPLDLLLAAARDPDRAERVLRSEERFRHMAQAGEIVKTAVKTFPMALFTGYYWLDRYNLPDLMQDQDVVQALHSLAKDPKAASDILRNYDELSGVDGIEDIVRTAIESDPASYLIYVRQGRVPRELVEDPSFMPSARSLMEAARRAETVDARGATSIIRILEAYAHFPEAADILQTAADTDVVGYIRNYSEIAQMMDERGIVVTPSASALTQAAEDPEHSSTLIANFPAYAALPEARQIVATAINAYPLSYFRLKKERRLPEAIENDTALFPDSARLAALAENSSTSEDANLLFYYHYFAHLPNAPDIARSFIEAYPADYLSYLHRSEYSAQLMDLALLPTAAAIREAIDNGDFHYRRSIFNYYDEIRILPEFEDLWTHAIARDPVAYYSARANDVLPPHIANNPAYMPDSEILMAYLERASAGGERGSHRAVWDLMQYYPVFKDQPGAPDVIARMVEIGFDSVWESIIENRFYDDDSGDRAAFTALGRELFLARPADVAAYHHDSRRRGFSALFQIAGNQPVLLERILEIGRGKPNGLFEFFASDGYGELIDKIDRKWKEKFVAVFTPMLDGTCADSDNADSAIYTMISRPGSWLMQSGMITTEQLTRGVRCLAERYPRDTLSALEKSRDRLGIDPREMDMIIARAVLANPLYYLAKTTQDEHAADFRIAGTTIGYQALLAAGQEEINDRENGGDRYIISTLNNLHNYDGATRFALIATLEDARYLDLITRDDSDYYTSTFNFLLDRTLDALRADPELRAQLFAPAEKGWRRYDTPLQKLMANTMQFGRLEDFLSVFSPDQIKQATATVLEGLEADRFYMGDTAVMAATAVETLQFMAAAGYAEIVEQALVAAFNAAAHDTATANVIGHVAALYSDTRRAHETHKEFFAAARDTYLPALGGYMRTTLEADTLFDEQGRNFQMMVFYDDEDGHSSFHHFAAVYRDDPRWTFKDHGQFVSFSREGIALYANKPWHEKSGPEAIRKHVEAQDGTISVLVHRGHSYHVERTAERFLNDDVNFFWLGSCRSSAIWRYIDDAPNMQFIYSSNIGSMRVNDPMLKNINDTLAQRRDVNWLDVRENASRLSGSKYVKNYVFPDGSAEYGMRMALSLFFEDRALSQNALNSLTAALPQQDTPGDPSALPAPPVQQQAMPFYPGFDY